MAHFCCHDHGEIVRKAAKKRPSWNKTRNPKRMEALAKRFGNAISADLVNGIYSFRKKIPNPQVLHDAWMSGKWDGLDRVIPWNKLEGDLEPAKATLKTGLPIFGALGLEAIPAPVRSELRYDYKNPAIERVFDKRAAEWVVGISNDTRESIKQVVHTQMANAQSPRDMALQIKDTIGLYPRLAQAHANYTAKLVQQGVSPERVDQLSGKYYDKLLTYRAKTIARTETQFMLNRGQLEVWKQADRDGLIPKTAVKVWVVDGDPCPECQEMDGEEVGVNEPWITEEGPVDIPSEIHPNCNCIMTLDF